METIIKNKKRSLKVVTAEGVISKEAARSLGCEVIGMLQKLVGTDGKFKDAKLQAKFEAWQQTPEGMKYA